MTRSKKQLRQTVKRKHEAAVRSQSRATAALAESREAIVAAIDQGVRVVDIAEDLGISISRIYQIRDSVREEQQASRGA